ncbi:MAG: hypothetical protein N3F66_10455 [Spirochaetes bacterium]|nr:hypothetical protein [Spirochaetota bacterium]
MSLGFHANFYHSYRIDTNDEAGFGKDIFGVYSPYVRTQEMMVSAGNFNLYNELGIKGVVLYYSSIPFDAFRVFVDELSLEEAHNPLIYNNQLTKETMLVIPAYNHADLIENISIYNWVQMLRYQQLRGNIQKDVLICINSDADDSYWYGYNLPQYLKWVPNTGGLSQLIDDIASLDYVEFTTISEYVKHHKPLKEISFGQDTAFGSFNGNVSWAEKKYCSDYWTAVEKDRSIHQLVKSMYAYLKKDIPADMTKSLQQSFEKRMRPLSTTNFGVATPFLAKNREHVVEDIMSDLHLLTAHVVESIKKIWNCQ